MRIALVQCPGWGRDCPPYTIALLSAILRKDGHKVFGFDLNNTLYLSCPTEYRKMWDDKDLYSFWSDKEIMNRFLDDNKQMIEFQVEKILSTDAKLIGFTIHFTSILVSLAVAKMIKQIDRSKFIVFGGPECSGQQRGYEIIKENVVDAISVGEGDLLISDLARKLEQQHELDFCKGLLFKKNGQIINGGRPDIVKDINKLPIPDYSDFKEDISSGLYRQPERLEIFDSRGCIVKCHFCSEWQFWEVFRSMSGERIYQEIAYQVKQFPNINYFYFTGSLLNGNMKSLDKFCDLVIKNNLNIKWAGQAIIRPEMSKEFLEKMNRAGCSWLSYGIESGSQRIVDRMNKRFSLKEAEQVLSNTHHAGIEVQANFMFGIPGETDKDFRQTLKFIKRNRENIDSVLASQSFCVIDKGTYLYDKAEEFGIKNKDHHLYWETEDGNTYPERFKRYEEFCHLALSLGIPETSGVLRKKPDKWKLLGDYYNYKDEYKKAITCYEKARNEEKPTKDLFLKLRYCYKQVKSLAKVEEYDRLISDYKTRPDSSNKEADFPDISEADIDLNYENIASLSSLELFNKLIHIKEKIHQADINKIIRNLNFNQSQAWLSNLFFKQKEWDKVLNFILIEVQKRRLETRLYGYPYWLVIDPTNFCNLRCPFCPTGQDRGVRTKAKLSFENFKRIIDELGPYLIHIDFCNWGEPLLNEEIFEMIKYAKKYNIDTKMDTNLHYLDKDRIKELLESGLDKLIVSIDGATAKTYSKYRIGGNFSKVMKNLKLLVKERERLGYNNPFITWQFLVFRHNEHEIEKAKRMGLEMGVDEVGISKAFIGDKSWIPLNQKYSRYDKERIKTRQDYTSNHFKPAPASECNWPWEAIVINPNGSVSPCCSVEDEKDDFGNIFKHPFKEVWNNQNYKIARSYIKNKNVVFDKNICVGCKHLGMINLDIRTCYDFYRKVDVKG